MKKGVTNSERKEEREERNVETAMKKERTYRANLNAVNEVKHSKENGDATESNHDVNNGEGGDVRQ